MEYYTKYKLKIDLPTGHEAGSELGFFVNDKDQIVYAFYKWDEFWKKYGIHLDYEGQKFTLEQIQNERFFEPIGEPKPVILPFPSKERFEQDYHLLGESRLVNEVDYVRLINPVFNSDKFYDAVYELLKKMYNEHYNLK